MTRIWKPIVLGIIAAFMLTACATTPDRRLLTACEGWTSLVAEANVALAQDRLSLKNARHVRDAIPVGQALCDGPSNNPEATLAELQRIINDLRLRGVRR